MPKPTEPEVLNGAPGSDQPGAQTPAASPEKKSTKAKVAIGGREFEVDADLAAAIQAQGQAFQEYQRQTAEYVQQLVESVQKPKADDKPAEQQAPDFFEAPEKAIAYHVGKALAEFEQKLDQKLTAGERKTREKQFWDEFYGEHKDLAASKALVQGVMHANLNELADLPVSQAKKKLAELARAERDALVKPFLLCSRVRSPVKVRGRW